MFHWSDQPLLVLIFAGLHDAADNVEGKKSGQVSGLLHPGPRHDVRNLFLCSFLL